MDEVNEECGIAAVRLGNSLKQYPEGKAAYFLYKMLLQQQNRGQLSAGITTYEPKRRQIISTYKQLGNVYEAFRASHKAKNNAIMGKYAGKSGIGHVRYATSGLDDKSYAQPFERQHGRKWKWFSFAFNGNLANYSELKTELAKYSYHLVRETDSEIIMHYLSRELRGEEKPELVDIFSGISAEFDGAYSLAFLNAEGDLVIARDPIGFKPLCYGAKDDDAFAASESAAFANYSDSAVNPVEPGEMILFGEGNIERKRFAKSKRKAHCMFEWVYFANVSSTLDGVNVYDARWNLGKELARLETEKPSADHVVVPVPDTSKPAADALSYELGIPSKEGLIRNRFVGRTFIESSDRLAKVKDKFTINKSVLNGKKVLLVEDSIVRGTTVNALVSYLRDVGKAKEVHVRVSCPPILYPCFYGIDMSTISELIAPKYMKAAGKAQAEPDVEKLSAAIAKETGADSVIYQNIDGLTKSIGIGNSCSGLCTACLNADYPTECGKKLLEKAEANFSHGFCGRTYE